MGIRAKGIFGSLPILAAAFGRERGVTVGIGGEEAFVRPGHIQLPDLPLDCDDDLETKAMGFIFHETGHMEFTDLAVMQMANSPMERFIYNAVEDARMEAARNSTYPGSAASLAKLAGLLSREGWFGTADKVAQAQPQNVLATGILVKLRGGYLGQPIGDIQDLWWNRLCELLGEAGTLKLEVLLGQMDQLDTSADAMRLAIAMKTLIEDVANQEEPQRDDSDDSEEGESGSEGQSGDSGSEDQTGGNAGQDAEGSDGNDSGTGDSDVAEGSGGTDSSGDDGQEPSAGRGAEPGSSGTRQGRPDQEALKQALGAGDAEFDSTDMGDALQKSLSDSASHAVAAAGEESTVSAPSRLLRVPRREGGEVKEVNRTSKALRTRLVSVMDAKARTRTTHRSQGNRLDGAKIHRLFTGSSRVFIRKEWNRKVNTAVQILLDRSGSMAWTTEGVVRMPVARQAALAAATGISQIHGCKVAVAAFPGVEVLKDFDEQVRGVTGRFLVAPNGSTPLGGAMLAVAPGLASRQEQRKMLIVVTDGAPDDPQRVKSLVSRYRASGVEVVGVGIACDAVRELFPSWTVIRDVNELAPALFNVIKDKLKRVA